MVTGSIGLGVESIVLPFFVFIVLCIYLSTNVIKSQ